MSQNKFMVLRCSSKSVYYNDDSEIFVDYDFKGVKFFDTREAADAERERLNIDAMRTGFDIHWTIREYNDHDYYEHSDIYLKEIANGTDPDDAREIAKEADDQSYGTIYLSDRTQFDKIYDEIKGYLPYTVEAITVNN